MKLDAKAKRVIRKDRFGICGYIYNDGIIIRYREKHTYKGEDFEKEFLLKYPGDIRVSISNGNGEGPFIGRIVMHNPSILLDGIDHIRIYRNNQSESMKEKNIFCDTVTIRTDGGMNIKEDVFPFLSSEITIQNGSKMSIGTFA